MSRSALDRSSRCSSISYILSPDWLRIDPTFVPFRDNPRFKRMVEGGS